MTQWEGKGRRWGYIETGAQWDGYTMRWAHNGTGTQWDEEKWDEDTI